MRAIAFLSLLLVAFAGCADEPAEDETPETSQTLTATQGETPDPEAPDEEGEEPEASQTPDEPEENSTAPEPANEPPTVTLTADVQEGQTPLKVVFSVTVEDADGDLLWWSFDADADGTEDFNGTENADAEFTYTEGGTYVAHVNVTDGQAIANATVEIVVATPPPVEEIMECTATLGAAVVSLTTPVANVGGCNMGTLSADAIMAEYAPGASCDIQFDANGDGQADGTAAQGATYPSGYGFTAFCQPGAVNAENRAVFHLI